MIYLEVIIVLLIGVIIYLISKQEKIKEKAGEDIFNLFLSNVFDDRVSWFRTMNKYVKDRPSVFVGDSLTQEFLLTEVLSGYNVCNRGIGGDTTNGVLKRMRESVYDLNPKKLFLQIGANDYTITKNTIKEIRDNIAKISSLSLKKIPDLEVYLIALYPVGEKAFIQVDGVDVKYSDANKKIRDTNKLIKELALNSNYTYIDAYELFSDEKGNLTNEWTRDGIHLSPLGYEILEKELVKYL